VFKHKLTGATLLVFALCMVFLLATLWPARKTTNPARKSNTKRSRIPKSGNRNGRAYDAWW